MFLRQPWCPSSNSHLHPQNAHLLPRPGEVHNHRPEMALPLNGPAGEPTEGKSPAIFLCAPQATSQPRKRPQIFPLRVTPLFIAYNRGQPTFSVKSQMVNISGFSGHTGVSATAASYIREWVWLCSDNTLLIKTCSGPDLAHKSSFAHPWPMRLRSGNGQKLSCRSPGTKQGGLPFRFSNRVSWALPTFYSPREANGASTALPVTMASQSRLLARLAVPRSLQVL